MVLEPVGWALRSPAWPTRWNFRMVEIAGVTTQSGKGIFGQNLPRMWQLQLQDGYFSHSFSVCLVCLMSREIMGTWRRLQK